VHGWALMSASASISEGTYECECKFKQKHSFALMSTSASVSEGTHSHSVALGRCRYDALQLLTIFYGLSSATHEGLGQSAVYVVCTKLAEKPAKLW
jgi:hypothetical protein